MCGIYFEYIEGKCPQHGSFKEDARVWELLSSRGPDCVGEVYKQSASGSRMRLRATTLWTQGARPTPQPLLSQHGVLIFNGDVFNADWDTATQSDSTQLMERLQQDNHATLSCLQSLEGPFSCVYWETREQRLYFCRDLLGRNSLLLSPSLDKVGRLGFILASVLPRQYVNVIELPSGVIYCLNTRTEVMEEYDWKLKLQRSLPLQEWLQNITQNRIICPQMPRQALSLPQVPAYVERITHLATKFKNPQDLIREISQDGCLQDQVKNLLSVLDASVRVRVTRIPNSCLSCGPNSCPPNHCRVGVLFSGGLDCSVLAALAHQYLPLSQPIDLLSVAFSLPVDSIDPFDVPDRRTALSTLKELQAVYPGRVWNLLEIDVSREELLQQQLQVIADLVSPLQTVLDESLGSALWFAGRGQSKLSNSACRILLVGSGADELLGGYSRHRLALSRVGWEALQQELLMDWERLPSRNLARDDRVLAHHARQPRAPYVDESVAKFILSLQPWEKCIPGLGLPPGIGDKLLLRLVAHSLGLTSLAILPKRALQFGSRIANKKENGSDISLRFSSLNVT